MARRTPSNVQVLITENSAMKRKAAIKTFLANGYKRHQGSSQNNVVKLSRGKVKVEINWEPNSTFVVKKLDRKRK